MFHVKRIAFFGLLLSLAAMISGIFVDLEAHWFLGFVISGFIGFIFFTVLYLDYADRYENGDTFFRNLILIRDQWGGWQDLDEVAKAVYTALLLCVTAIIVVLVWFLVSYFLSTSPHVGT